MEFPYDSFSREGDVLQAHLSMGQSNNTADTLELVRQPASSPWSANNPPLAHMSAVTPSYQASTKTSLKAEANYTSMSKRDAENNVTSCRNFISQTSNYLSERKLQDLHRTHIATNCSDSVSKSSDFEPVVQGNFL